MSRALTTLGIKIILDGNVVGAIQSFSSNHTRNVTKLREVGSDVPGEVVDIVPGVEDATLQVNGFAIAPIRSGEFETLPNRITTEGNKRLLSLMDQKIPFSLIEELGSPDGNITARIEYEGCMLTNYSRNVTIEGNFVVAENASLAVSNVRAVD